MREFVQQDGGKQCEYVKYVAGGRLTVAQANHQEENEQQDKGKVQSNRDAH